MSIQLVVNGEPRAVPEDALVADVVAALGVTGPGVAVAVNGEVVPRSDWARHRLHGADRVEVLTATQGG